MSVATTGRPAAMASRTTRPQPSLTEGKARASAAWYQSGSSSSATVPSSDDVAVEAQPEVGQAREHLVAVPPVVLERSGRRRRRAPPAGRRGRRPGPSARTRWSLPLRGSMPPTARSRKAVVGTGPGAEPGRVRCAGARRRIGLGRRRWGRPRPRRRSRRAGCAATCRITTSTTSGSTMARRWQSTSAGVVKSSTWWTVRTTVTGAPSSRSRAAARAEMQSWAWSTVAKSGPSRRRPSAMASSAANTRSSERRPRRAAPG